MFKRLFRGSEDSNSWIPGAPKQRRARTISNPPGKLFNGNSIRFVFIPDKIRFYFQKKKKNYQDFIVSSKIIQNTIQARYIIRRVTSVNTCPGVTENAFSSWYLLGGFEVLEDPVNGTSIHEEMVLDALHHHPKTTSFETVGH